MDERIEPLSGAMILMLAWFLIVATLCWFGLPLIWAREARVKTHAALEEIHRYDEARK